MSRRGFGKQWRTLATRFRRTRLLDRYPDEKPPLRAELFSSDQMEQHGRKLAAAHRLLPGRGPDRLLQRLAENERILLDVCNMLTAAVTAGRRVTPAAEWLLDNFYLIEEQVRTAKRHLPKGYSRELPRLAHGPSARLPRVYDLAFEAIAHGDGRVDVESLSRFVIAYQTVAPLKLGELWALPIMLRLALIENLRRVGARVAAGTLDRHGAEKWADQMLDVAERDPTSLILVIADMARSRPPMVSSFVAELARRLQGHSAALALPLTWIEQRLAESATSIEQLVQAEAQEQAGEQVSISNTIGSLRLLGSTDWRDFVETTSSVEHKLREDPLGVYAGMDFATRDRYRHVVEEIAKQSDLSEGEVARKAIQLAYTNDGGGARADGDRSRDAHVGFYLIDKGRPRLEQAARVRFLLPKALRRLAGRVPLLLFVGATVAITAVTTAALLAQATGSGVSRGVLAVVAVLVLLGASQLGVGIVNWLATLLVSPCALPRMDFSHGLPQQSRTLVVVPTMLDRADSVEALLEALEVRFLANQDANLHFGLLTDFTDAAQESLVADLPLLESARAGIEALNAKYRDAGRPADDGTHSDIFFLFHRPRRWNAAEGLWMGHERKRGKLADLNVLLRGGGQDRFSLVVGDTAGLSAVRYVITLDTDTQLPRDSARQLVGAMAHPLNRPRFGTSGRRLDAERVTEGYGILQPRVSISLPGANRSLYAHVHAGDAGIDPYTRAVSDVYQDVFGEGSFIGKGIYDVDAFERALAGRFPENRILSHDLLEGCYARSGLLSDVQLYEEYPATYAADIGRRHRWIRGDWQLLAWLLPWVPGHDRRVRNPLSALSVLKIFDNLRRSLVPPALTLLLVIAWTMLPRAGLWTLSAVAILLLPSACAVVVDLLRKPDEVRLRQHLAATRDAAVTRAMQATLALTFLFYEAAVNLDAIARVAWRTLVSHRRLLEWNPSGAVEAQRIRTLDSASRSPLVTTIVAMWIAPVAALAVAMMLAALAPQTLAIAAPILLLWFLSPAVAWWTGRPSVRREARLTLEQTRFLRKLARRTWAFFETYAGPDDHWLCPDNIQEHPLAAVAHRTSPTNMGLSLLANLSAYDMGYVPAGQLVQRTAAAMATMQGLDRHAGHFYNWYDTQSGTPLPPLYVSTVDSGNLAGHLLTLRQGLVALADDRIIAPQWLEGLSDTLRTLDEALDGAGAAPLLRLQHDLEAAYDSRPTTVDAAVRWLDRLSACMADVATHLAALPGRHDETSAAAVGDATFWIEATSRQLAIMQEEVAFLAPWTALSSPPPGLSEVDGVREIPTLRELAAREIHLSPAIASQRSASIPPEERAWLDDFADAVTVGRRRARDRITEIERLATLCDDLARMEYGFLYDGSRHLLAIGYNVSERRRDSSYYDLLASEARFASFVAIAQGRLPQENWFALGRLLTNAGGQPTLLSWSGSMFEYLMPMLVMPTYDNTLLDETSRVTVDRQIAYGKRRGVPWGISESGYNAVDTGLNYQYRAFGVPGLGLKRGLAMDLVVAPYASALALAIAPDAACQNLQRLGAEGLAGNFGLYEAVDYTPARLPRGQSSAVVRSFMAHHQGMILLAIVQVLLGRPMQKRFESDPRFKATLPLLQERIPRSAAGFAQPVELAATRGIAEGPEASMRIFATPDTPVPEVQLLSNGRYHVMVTNAGGGYTRWKDLAVTRWREDSTCDHWGSFCYIRDLATGDCWSTAYQPTRKRPAQYEAIFTEASAEFRRRDNDFETRTEIVVSPEDDIELRRVRVTNRARVRRTIEVTSYAEVALAPPAADALHPSFSNLFVQTEIDAQPRAILCTRRPRSRGEHVPWMFHLMALHGAESVDVSYETDRAAFIGRGRTVAAPRAMDAAGRLSGSAGSVLDPIVAIRHRIALEPHQTATIDIAYGVAETRENAVGLVGKYQDRHLADRVFGLAWTHSWVTLRQINATESDAQLYARLASSVIYANASLRAETRVLLRNRRGQPGLWSYAISGDLPIVLLQIGDTENFDLVRRLVQAHAYWRLKGLAVDLVIWNEDRGGYRQVLQDQIMGLIAAGVEAHVMDRPGGIFVRRAEQIADEDRILLQSVARAIITDRRGGLAEQLTRRAVPDVRVPRLVPTRPLPDPATAASPLAPRDLILHNGIGGFTRDGREYVISIEAGQVTPAPWANVLANPEFGCVISEAGVSYTWTENAHEFRLTPWHNDPVGDASGEAFFLRDEESGHCWSPAALPARGAGPYVTRHGFGYSVFEHEEDGIASELWVYVAIDAPVKFSVLKIRNTSGRARHLSATGYVEWVLGDLRPKTSMHVITEIDARNGAVLARNAYNTEFPDRVAFFDVDDPARSVSGDRTEFLGRNGALGAPAAMQRTRLSGKAGAGLDPCAALQVAVDLAAGEGREIVFRLGVGRNLAETTSLLQRARGPAGADATLQAVHAHWRRSLGTLQVDTPDPAVNVMANGWLIYQTVACRLWARSGYYQSGGAFGFRDQLQDTMALAHAEPGLMREHLLRCASRQFAEGDVQHWWHPPSGRGVRTHCSDDYLWLPLATARYVRATGDAGVLEEPIQFLDGRPVNAGDDSYYDLPGRSAESASLYDHCVRAIVHGLRFGAHGLPLMGSGDWNDGMNLVGSKGAGESVWLGFFLCAVLAQFEEIAQRHGDAPFAERCAAERGNLGRNLELHGWDGAWYRRAFFDDGSPLGSAKNAECRIDSVAQSWSVLSGVGDAARSRMAMQALDDHLVRRDAGLVQLLDPPFDRSSLDPGYIRGYVPGVRENGGQYTHGAIWAAMAFADLGDRDRAWQLATMINPVTHANTAAGVATYKVEPYVIAADVYAVDPHVGRGGWSWYTGSAGWMYRLLVESLLGITREQGRLRFKPCIPPHWPGFRIDYQHGETRYEISVAQGRERGGIEVTRVALDGVVQDDDSIALADDRVLHRVTVDVQTGTG